MTQDHAAAALLAMAAPWLYVPPRLSDHIVGAGNQQEAKEET